MNPFIFGISYPQITNQKDKLFERFGLFSMGIFDLAIIPDTCNLMSEKLKPFVQQFENELGKIFKLTSINEIRYFKLQAFLFWQAISG
jgi:hypothetical protein